MQGDKIRKQENVQIAGPKKKSPDERGGRHIARKSERENRRTWTQYPCNKESYQGPDANAINEHKMGIGCMSSLFISMGSPNQTNVS
jgi:hypothetical protein